MDPPQARDRERAESDDPVLRLHAQAGEEDAPLTAEDQAVIDVGLAELRRGDTLPLERDQPAG